MAASTDHFNATPVVEQLDAGITIHWDAGHSNFYHYFWLRSACHCDRCGDSYTGSRRLHPSDVPIDIEPLVVEACSDHLQISWPPDQHASQYDYNWLREFAYDDDSRTWHPCLWDASLPLDEVSHQLDQVKADNSAYLDFLRTLRDYGVSIMRGEQARGIENMAALIGNIAEATYNNIFDLKPDKKAHTYGNTHNFVPPHTDESYLHTPTGILVLYCVNPATQGGESVLVDGFQIATQLREQNPAAFEVLCTCPQANHRIVHAEGLDHRTRNRALNVDEKGNLVGIRFHPRSMAPIDVGGDLARQLHSANYALSELMLQESNQLCFQLQAGDAVFFDNHRVMHSRKAFDDPNRYLQICNVAREQFHQKLRLTAHQQGYYDEARQSLPAGVSG